MGFSSLGELRVAGLLGQEAYDRFRILGYRALGFRGFSYDL